MFWKNLRGNLIKWWRIVYIPIARKIFHTRLEQEAYDSAKDEKEKNKATVNPALLKNKNYNATTGAMSGEYGTHEMDDKTKKQLNSILTNNYSTTNLVNSLIAEQTEKTLSLSKSDTTLTPEEDAAIKAAQIRKANEIYERLLQEAKEDELKRQQEITAAMEAAQINKN